MGVRGGAGKLRHKIKNQRKTTTDDSHGYPVEAFTDVRETRANIVMLKAEERIEAQRVQGKTSHQIRMRYDADLAYADRIVLNSRKFDIEQVWNVNERNVESVAVVVEVT